MGSNKIERTEVDKDINEKSGRGKGITLPTCFMDMP
jgi:hypothetical protein